ncbi:MAG: P-type Cu+ transporter, partial [Solirubrobacteraceae bacterium]|nr:P-type Cu+ transporter [Solirubrobacteraceae bacterium]
LVLNVLATGVFLALFWMTVRRGAIDPVCGMTVDRSTPHRAQAGNTTVYFCSEDCRSRFLADPDQYVREPIRVERFRV